MNMQSHKLTLLALLAVASVTFAAHPTTQEMQQMMARFEAARQADFLLKGIVVDEGGHKLSGATMMVEEGRSKKGGVATDYSSRSQTVDGEFTVQAKQMTSVTLFLWKEGYHTESVAFSVQDALPVDWRQRLSRGEKVGPVEVKKEAIAVVLRKHGPLVALKGVGGEITFVPSGPCKVWNLASKTWRAITQVKNVTDEALLPPSCIYLVADVTDAGKLALGQVRYKQAPQPCPQKIRLVMKGDGGFVPVPTIGPSLERQYQSMTEAPSKGYVQELVMEGGAMEKHFLSESDGGTREGAFFYFRAGKEYGKGCLFVDFPRGNEASVRLSLRFQEDGSRNLETSK